MQKAVWVVSILTSAILLAACDGQTLATPQQVASAEPVTESNSVELAPGVVDALASEDAKPSLNVDPVVDPLDRPGDRSVALPASVINASVYDETRDGLFETYRTALKLEYVVVAQDFRMAGNCHYGTVAFHAATDAVVSTCFRFKEGTPGRKGLHFHNLNPDLKKIDVSFQVINVRFSPDGSKLFICRWEARNEPPAYVADLKTGAIVGLPEAAKTVCKENFEWVADWHLAREVGPRTREIFDLKTLATTSEQVAADASVAPKLKPAIEHWKSNRASAETYAKVGVNGITTKVFDRDYGNSDTNKAASGRWIATRHAGDVELVHLKVLGDYSQVVPSISFRVSEEDLAAMKKQGGEVAWLLKVNRELRNPLVDNEVVGAAPKTYLGEFRLIGCGTDLVCDAIPLRPVEMATQAFNRFASDLSGLVVTNLRSGDEEDAPTPFTADRFWVVETGRLR